MVGVSGRRRTGSATGSARSSGTPALRAGRGQLRRPERDGPAADGAADAAGVRPRVDRLDRRAATGATGQEFGDAAVALPDLGRRPGGGAAGTPSWTGCWCCWWSPLVGGLLAVGQALARHHAAGAADQELEAALGLTRAERVAARLLPALLGAAIAAVLAAAGALLRRAASSRSGRSRRTSPRPGYLADPRSWSAVGRRCGRWSFLLLAGASRRPGWRAGRPPRPRAAALRPLPRLGRRRAGLAGLAFALRRDAAGPRVPVRATASSRCSASRESWPSATFAASLDRLASTPARYGWVADFATVDAKPETPPPLAADPRVAAVAVGRRGSVASTAADERDRPVRKVVGAGAAPGAVRPAADSGRARPRWAPARPGRLGAEVGDRVTLGTYGDAGRRGAAQPARWSACAQPGPERRAASAARRHLWPGDLRAGMRGHAVRRRAGQGGRDRRRGALYRELSQRLEMTRAPQPRAGAQPRGAGPAALGARGVPRAARRGGPRALAGAHRPPPERRPGRPAGDRDDPAPGRGQRRGDGRHA